LDVEWPWHCGEPWEDTILGRVKRRVTEKICQTLENFRWNTAILTSDQISIVAIVSENFDEQTKTTLKIFEFDEQLTSEDDSRSPYEHSKCWVLKFF
jgi:hypothetical protein